MSTRFSLENADTYGDHYNDHSFWKKLGHLATQAGHKVIYPALQLYYLLRSPTVPTKAKTLIVGALGYLILPIDLMPDFVLALGLTDDLTALLLVVRTLNHYITPDIKRQAHEQADRLLAPHSKTDR